MLFCLEISSDEQIRPLHLTSAYVEFLGHKQNETSFFDSLPHALFPA